MFFRFEETWGWTQKHKQGIERLIDMLQFKDFLLGMDIALSPRRIRTG